MPEEPRRRRAAPDTTQRRSRHSATPESDEQPPEQGRRRRSLEDSGGVSVSDLLSRNTGAPAGPAPQRPAPPQQQRSQQRQQQGRQQETVRARPARPRSQQDTPDQPTRRTPPIPSAREGSGPQPGLPPRSRRNNTQRKPAEPAEPAEQRRPPGPPPRPAPGPPDDDPNLMTTELEPIGEEVVRRRRMDNTLTRFSALHDEIAEEERRKRSKRSRYLPWVSEDDELEDALTFAGPRTAAQAAVTDDTGDRGEDDVSDAAAGDDSGSRGAAERKPLTRLREKKRRRSERGLRAARIAAIALSALVLLASGVAWGAKQWVNANLIEIAALDENSSDIQDAASQVGDENFLLVGSDTRAGATAADHVGTVAQVRGARSDTVMVAHISHDRSRVVVTSFPRDLEVDRPACQRWNPRSGAYTGAVAPPAAHTKLNDVYAVGGPKCMTKTVQRLSGLKINHFTGIDFNGFKGMVDAVGGVPVCSTEPLRDSVLGTVLPQAGTTTISGDTALNYVRARHVIGDPTSDYGRIERQQKFLSSLLRKVMSSDVLLDVGKLQGFVEAFGRSTYGENMGVDQLVTLAQSMRGLDSGGVTFVTVPTVGTANERGNEVLRQGPAAALFHAVRKDRPLPGHGQAGSGTAGPGTAGSADTKAQAKASPRPQARPLPASRDVPAGGGAADLSTVNGADTSCG